MTAEQEFKKRYRKLNHQQKQAVDNIEGPMLVVAGPGSGKTELLSLRVANILRKADIYPQNILCLTFTDSAAFNMRDRLRGLIGDDAYRVAIHTFHSFGVEIMEQHRELFYEGAIFNSVDELTQTAIIEDILKNLSHDNPLSKTHPEYGYIFSKSVKDSIQHLKKAGLTPKEFLVILNHNKKAIKFLNPLVEKAFGTRITKKTINRADEVLSEIKAKSIKNFPVSNMEPLLNVVERSLERAIDKSASSGKTSPLTQWKKSWTKKTNKGKRVLQDSCYIDKMEALADVYKKYRQTMFKKGYYDFDDMILEVIKTIEQNKSLQYELQEQYFYILVDEFQDTNDAQTRLLHLLTDNPVNEGRPNIMAVGDDDQAIYKFQGAEISNIIKFKNHYRSPDIISLVKNYRSQQDILDVARHVITKGEERLEKIIPELNKALIAAKEDIQEGDIHSKEFSDPNHQYLWITKEIKRLIKKGKQPEEIAVIARTHKELEKMASFLSKESISVSYERQKDVLKEPHIMQLVKIARFINTLLNKSTDEADYLLPDILSFSFWNISRKDLWKLSANAHQQRKNWIDCMLESDNNYFNKMAEFFLSLSQKAKYQPVEKILDDIIGTKIPNSQIAQEITSPFKDYYFGKQKFQQNPGKYLSFLSSLRAFIYALREYKKGAFLKTEDLIEFVDIHLDNNLPLLDKNPFVTGEEAVHLTTAHGAKGLEFDTVFVMSCQDEVWAKNKGREILPFPSNLPISPAGDTRDDQLRLFYVAISRAKSNLYLTSFRLKENGRESTRLHFLSKNNQPKLSPDKVSKKEIVNNSGNAEQATTAVNNFLERVIFNRPPFAKNEEVLLKKLLENYQLNVTHFNNFLNVADGGPQKFLEDNLLRFPQPKSAPLSYGSAMHYTMEQIYKYLKNTQNPPIQSKVTKWFEKFLRDERLGPKEFKHFFERGKDALKVFYSNRKDSFDSSHIVEFSFKNQGVVVDEVPLGGKIDKIVKKGDKEIQVHDFKTGRYTKDWKGKTKHDKIKLWKYKNQLIFYKVLIERSRRFSSENYKVKRGVLEFLEPTEDKEIIVLPLEIKDKQVEDLKQLIRKVYQKIINLDFPNTNDYREDIKGIEQFQKDLLD